MAVWFSKYSSVGMVLLGIVLMIVGTYGASRFFISQDDVVVDDGRINGVNSFGFAPYLVPELGITRDEQSAPKLLVTPNLIEQAVNNESEKLGFHITPNVKESDRNSSGVLTSNTKSDVSPEIPGRLIIDSISLDVPVMQARSRKVWMQAQQYTQWLAPDMYAVGWHPSSAMLGAGGNTVINGHHNMDGMVFAHLVDVKEGDIVKVMGANRIFEYVVVNKMILPEKGAAPEQRLENARWIMPSGDERLTLVSCWPFESNTHRLILVAVPLGSKPIN